MFAPCDETLPTKLGGGTEFKLFALKGHRKCSKYVMFEYMMLMVPCISAPPPRTLEAILLTMFKMAS